MAPNWLASLVPKLRALEAENTQLRDTVTSLTDEKLRLQDRMDAAVQDRSRMWDLLHKSIDEMKIAYQMHVNQSWQRQGGGVPYPDAPHLPPAAVPKPPSSEPIGRRRMLPSEAVAREADRFIESVIKP